MTYGQYTDFASPGQEDNLSFSIEGFVMNPHLSNELDISDVGERPVQEEDEDSDDFARRLAEYEQVRAEWENVKSVFSLATFLQSIY